MHQRKEPSMNISKIRKIISEEGIEFSFSGLISQSLAEFMVETASVQFDLARHDSNATKNMHLIAIEQLQNIMNYSDQKYIQDGNKSRYNKI